MKKVYLVITICFMCLVGGNKAMAIDLGDLVKTDEQGRVAVSTDNLGKGLEEEVMKKVNQEIEKVSKEVEGQIKEVKAKADSEIARVTEIVDKAKEELDLIKRIKAKVQGYIMIGYIIAGALGVFLILLLLLLIKLWFKVSKIGKIGYAFKTIKNIDKRITDLENKVAKL
jgi:glycyl-tRNA synthetase (class II)